jgi:tetratricopeptide (TPR) repeat protein
VLSDDAVQSAAPADLSKVASADLALEADDRHANDFDISGAAKRYRELLARAGTPAELRHWHIRLGDCYFRLGMTEDAMREYRNCVDASTEDHGERVGCMIALAKNARTADPADARRWIDRALELEQGRSNRTVHEMAVFLARDASQTDVEVRELTWLVEHFPDEANAGAGWKERISDLRGEKR